MSLNSKPENKQRNQRGKVCEKRHRVTVEKNCIIQLQVNGIQELRILLVFYYTIHRKIPVYLLSKI